MKDTETPCPSDSFLSLRIAPLKCFPLRWRGPYLSYPLYGPEFCASCPWVCQNLFRSRGNDLFGKHPYLRGFSANTYGYIGRAGTSAEKLPEGVLRNPVFKRVKRYNNHSAAFSKRVDPVFEKAAEWLLYRFTRLKTG